jgi:hypothetical protein
MLSIPVSNTAAQQQGMTNATSSSAAAKPVDGYNLPQGHLNAVRHVLTTPPSGSNTFVSQATR